MQNSKGLSGQIDHLSEIDQVRVASEDASKFLGLAEVLLPNLSQQHLGNFLVPVDAHLFLIQIAAQIPAEAAPVLLRLPQSSYLSPVRSCMAMAIQSSPAVKPSISLLMVSGVRSSPAVLGR